MSSTEMPDGTPRARVGPRRVTLKATMWSVVLIAVWTAVTGWTGGPGFSDPTAWRMLLLTSMFVDVGMLLSCEWIARKGAAARPAIVVTAVAGWSAVTLLTLHAVALAAALVPATHADRANGAVATWFGVTGAVLVLANLSLGLGVGSLARRQGYGGSAAQYGEDAAAAPAHPSPDGPYVVACSGGGIRAAAFVLGGLNALQGLDPVRSRRGRLGTEVWASEESPRLVAVSGGSYAAAAVSLARAYEIDEGMVRRREAPLSWRAVYTPGSPEMARLRRHTRDLFEPGSQLALGIGSLVLGAALNVALALAALRSAAALIAWLSTRAGGLQLGRACTDGHPVCTFVDGLGGRGQWWADETILACLLLAGISIGAGVGLWVVQSRINRFRHDLDVRGPRSRVADQGAAVWALTVRGWLADRQRLREALARVRVFTQKAAGLLVFTLVVLPAVVAGLNHLALANAPTPSVAGVARTLGFATQAQCEAAGGADVARAVETAGLDARISPGEKHSATGGACGVVVTVTLTIGDPASCPATPGGGGCTPNPSLWTGLGAARVGAELESGRVGGFAKVFGSLATFLALLQTLRRSVSADDGPTGRGGALRRLLLMRLPIFVVGLVAVWLLGRWIFQFAVAPEALGHWAHTVVPLVALLVALLVDANVTSMHDYYRSRLANAFGAARSSRGPGKDERAVPLPGEHFYRFSELAGVPLTIATTANVQAYDSVPTRRGGAPLTVDESNLELHGGQPETSRRVAIAAYEEAVGYGYASVMSIVAMSGAAVSPLMGRFAATFGPFRALLALFNIRVGVWVPNPRFAPPEEIQGHDGSAWEAVRAWPARPWLTGRPGAMQVVAEAFGRSSFDDQWLYLSDGGHLDNTGIVESVRVALRTTPRGRDWRRVLALDASNDKEGSWSAVGDALAIVRADLGVRLERRDELSRSFAVAGADATAAAPSSLLPPAGRGLLRRNVPTGPVDEPHYARVYEDPERKVSLLVVKAVRPVDLEHADLPDSVRAFAASTTDFPRASTSRQDFSDLEFEAYRALGEWCTARAVGAARPGTA